MNYNYNHLYYFYIAAKSGGITAAAEHLHISQPSLSSQLKVLEESLSLNLFEKVGRKNQLTPSGLVIYDYCKKMFELAEKMTEVVTKSTPTSKRRIQIGVSHDVEKGLITEAVSNFLNQFPPDQRPQVNLMSESHSQLLDHLHFKEIDIIISTQKIEDSEFSRMIEAKIPVVLCCSPHYEHAALSKFSDNSALVNELAHGNPVQWVLPAGNFELRSQIDNFLEENMIPKKVIFESDSISTLVRSVHNGLGFSFLPLLYIASEIRQNNLLCFGSSVGFWDYHIALGCHPHNKEDSLVLGFVKSFQELCDLSSNSYVGKQVEQEKIQAYS